MDDAAKEADNCLPVAIGDYSSITEDINKFAVYVDNNDIEGIHFGTTQGTEYEFRANYPIMTPDPAA